MAWSQLNSSLTGGVSGSCTLSLWQLASVEASGTDLVRRTRDVEAARVWSVGRRCTSDETDKHLFRVALRSTSVLLLRTGFTFAGRHGDR